MMIGGFTFNGINTSEFKLVGRSVKRPLLPAKRQKRVELIGASGVYDFEGSDYDAREVTMRIIYIGKDYLELRTRARDIAAWLSPDSFKRLIMDDEADKYYLAKVTSELDLENFWQSGSVDVVFDCQPFAYSIKEENLTFGINGITFNNPGTRVINYKSPPGSRSILTITGTFSYVEVVINNTDGLVIQNLNNQTIQIDNVNMEAYVGYQVAFEKLGGNLDRFLGINPGENSIVFSALSGTITSATLSYNPMWY